MFKKLKNAIKEIMIEDITKVKDYLEEDKVKQQKEEKKQRYIKQLKDNKKKGQDYEKFVANYYEALEYIVKFNGIEKGKKDSSIDLIAIKNNEIVLIQCKNWKENGKYKINHEKIKAFIGDTYSFINNNKNYKDYEVKRVFAVSEKILDKSAIKYIKENKEIIRYLHLKMQ